MPAASHSRPDRAASSLARPDPRTRIPSRRPLRRPLRRRGVDVARRLRRFLAERPRLARGAPRLVRRACRDSARSGARACRRAGRSPPRTSSPDSRATRFGPFVNTTPSATWSSRIDGLRSRENVTSTIVPSYSRRDELRESLLGVRADRVRDGPVLSLDLELHRGAPFGIVANDRSQSNGRPARR